jgi:GH25 family lysozyme M1 (1,4-beta-N-acetylmuramidase)
MKSKRTIAASAVALVVVGGGAVAVLRLAAPGPSVIAPASLPSPAGPAVTAAVPGGGGAGQSGATGPAGQPGDGSGQPSTAAGGTYAPGTAPESKTLTRAAGQGAPGPLAAGTLPADGAVPGASQALRAMAAARQSLTALPHSPRLLAELGGTTGATSTAGPTTAPTASGDGTASPAPADTPSAAVSPTGTNTSTGTSTANGSLAGSSGALGSSRAGMAAAAAGATAHAASPSATATTTAAPTVTPTPTATTTAPPPTTPPPAPKAGRTLAGLDVAGYQHPVTKAYPKGQAIGWSSVASAGYKFVAIKATEGDYYVNPWAVTDLNAAKAAGLSVTPYHFAIPNASGGAAQAQYTLEYSGYRPGTRMLPLMLDIEYDPYTASDHTNICYGLTPAAMTAWVGAFVNTVKSITGLYPVIYTTANWWNTCTGGSTAFTADPMWVAAYGFTSPPMPAGWPAWTIWQYTSGGTVPGVASPGGTDLDIFNQGLVGLINPGSQAARTRARVSVSVRSLAALAGEAVAWSAAGLPPGLSLGASGTIAGTVAASAAPVAARVYHVTISARNPAGVVEKAAFAWQVRPTCAHHLTAQVCAGG